MRRALTPLALTICSVLGAALLFRLDSFRFLDQKLSDFHFLLRDTRPADDVVLLAVDQKSLEKLPEPLLLWHAYFAEAIRAAARAGAKVLGVDFYFAVPVDRWEADHDRLLVAAVAEVAPRMPVVCGFYPDRQDPAHPVPLYLYASPMGLTGFMYLPEDADAFVRRAHLVARHSNTTALEPSLAMRMAEKFLGKEIGLGDIPRDATGAITINYAGPVGTIKRISFVDLLEAARRGEDAKLRSWLEGKAALLGPDALALGDLHATPFFDRRKGTMAGFEIQANIVQSLIRGDFLRQAPAWSWATIAVLLASLSAASAYFFRLRRAALLTLVWAVLGYALIHLFFRGGIIFPAVPILLSVVLAGASGIASNLETRRRLLASAFSMFVGRKVAQAVEKEGNVSRLSAERRIVTVFFSDIRGFTAYCDTKEPVVVLRLLNAYLSGLAAVVRRYGGEVNKFMGDGIMAVFTDDDPGAGSGDHAVRAVRCGLDILRIESEFETAIGVHTGEAIIGTLGSSDKLEHTVLGDTVNVASRLEEMNKALSTRLLLSEETQKLLGNLVPLLDLGQTEIRGKTAPVRVFTPVAVAPARLLQGIGRMLALFGALVISTAWSASSAPKEQATGLVLSAGTGSQILRRGAQRLVQARSGDVLFTGDRVRTGDSPMTYLYCPGQFSETLAGNSEALIGAESVSVEKGRSDARKDTGSCALPKVLRLPEGAQRRLGGLAMRGEETESSAAEAAISVELQSKIADLTARVESNPADPLPRLARAIEWERASLTAKAIKDYGELQKLWPDAEWIRAKLFELQRPLHD